MNYGVYIKLADDIFLGRIPSTWEDKISTCRNPKNVTEILQNQQYEIWKNTMLGKEENQQKMWNGWMEKYPAAMKY